MPIAAGCASRAATLRSGDRNNIRDLWHAILPLNKAPRSIGYCIGAKGGEWRKGTHLNHVCVYMCAGSMEYLVDSLPAKSGATNAR